MISSRLRSVKLLFNGLLATSFCIVSATAQDNSLQFQRPGRAGEATHATSQQKFRAPSQPVAQPVKQVVAQSAPNPVAKQPAVKKVAAKTQARKPAAPISAPQVAKQPVVKRDTRVRRAQSEELPMTTEAETWEEPVYMDSMPMGQQGHMMMGESHMSGCQCDSCLCEPGCGAMDPGCGMMDPGCGCAEPSCGVAGCGDCVRPRGPDYWCFPVCLPRLQDVTFWGGVHGFRGPRDFIPAGRSDSNFGFQEGINLSGRAPFLGFLFPDLNYQLGFQAVQSRLHGTETSSDDRGQQFVTAGMFKRTQSGLQFGAVWDSMNDDLDEDVSLHQVRYELSLKTPRGRELGFWGASATNDDTVGANTFETTGQYCGFYRWNMKGGNQARIWGGASDDGEGILGADFYAPLNDRWSVQTGFNYLIPDDEDGLPGVSQESWNLGINLVWHWGRRAREGNVSPFRPLFNVADNGWMFVDRVD
ncbi:MAG: DUF6666 family protein [Bythopirellula sp.]|nr:DUF6666 family protein [Bythopirellula sp.]